MVQSAGLDPAADYALNELSTWTAAAEDASHFGVQLETAIIESTGPLLVRYGVDDYVCQGRR